MEIVVDLVLVPKWCSRCRLDGTKLPAPLFFDFTEQMDNWQSAQEMAESQGLGAVSLVLCEKNTERQLQEFTGQDCWERANEWLEMAGTVQEIR